MPTGMTPTDRDTCFTGTVEDHPLRVQHEPWADCAAKCKAKTGRQCNTSHPVSLQCARCGVNLKRPF